MESAAANTPNPASSVAARTEQLFSDHQNGIHRRTDRMFGYLMVLQWLGSIAAALWIAPRTWTGSGSVSPVQLHVWVAVFMGALIITVPVLLAWKCPGKTLTRHAIAIGQMLSSALLIHLTSGRSETHFHVFGSLAFLAFYRDWRVLVSATVVVALDHFARGVFWPQSVFGVLSVSPWRWMELAAWVIFEDIFLIVSLRRSLKETRMMAERQAQLEERQRELQTVNHGIEELVTKRSQELDQTHSKLLETSRKAGMAEVATAVLHNVGNVLNSVNVSVTQISDQMRKSRDVNVGKVAALMQERGADLGSFMTHDPKGRQLPAYLAQLAEYLAEEKTCILRETDTLRKHIDHIKDIIAMQQGFAKVSGVVEVVKPIDLAEDALRMNSSTLSRNDVQVVREYDENLPEINVQKHKALQILVNLIRNAKQASDEAGREDKRLVVKVSNGGDRIRISVVDNGIGISSENLQRIFTHGFTTKREGHGFGLHSARCAAEEMGGALTVHSDGPGKGAAFTLELPCKPKPKDS